MTGRAISKKLPIVVLASGEGTNLQAILDHAATDALPVIVRAVISDRPQARVLVRARSAGVTTETLFPAEYPDREHYDAALTKLIDHHAPGLVVLAGFMRILSNTFVHHYRSRLLNIHPALLPKYRGLHTHQRVLAAGEREHGCSVHFVTEELDGGPLIAQAKVPVQAGDTEKSLGTRVLRCEHALYPLVIRWFSEDRIGLEGNHVLFDGQPLSKPRVFESNEAIA